MLSWFLVPAALLHTALLLAGPSPVTAARTTGAVAIYVSCVHLAGIAFFLLRSPLPTRLLPLALVAVSWWIPALVPDLAGLLDASPRLARAPVRLDTWAALAPVGALVLAALLLPQARGATQ